VKGAKTISINPNANVLPMADAPKISAPEKPAVDEAKQAAENVEKIRAGKEANAGL